MDPVLLRAYHMHPCAHRAGALVPAPSAAVDGAGAASASAADARPRGQQTGTGDDCVGIFFCDLSVPDPKGCEVCAAHVCNLIDAEVRAPPQPRPAPAHQPRPAPRAAAAARRGSRAREDGARRRAGARDGAAGAWRVGQIMHRGYEVSWDPEGMDVLELVAASGGPAPLPAPPAPPAPLIPCTRSAVRAAAALGHGGRATAAGALLVLRPRCRAGLARAGWWQQQSDSKGGSGAWSWVQGLKRAGAAPCPAVPCPRGASAPPNPCMRGGAR